MKHAKKAGSLRRGKKAGHANAGKKRSGHKVRKWMIDREGAPRDRGGNPIIIAKRSCKFIHAENETHASPGGYVDFNVPAPTTIYFSDTCAFGFLQKNLNAGDNYLAVVGVNCETYYSFDTPPAKKPKTTHGPIIVVP